MTQSPIERLLKWRLAQAAATAPPPPRAALLLELARPWWEVWPERLQARLAHVRRMPVPAFGYAMVRTPNGHSAHPVPTILALAEDTEGYAWILYFSVRDGRLRLRFKLDDAAPVDAQALDVTFVADAPGEAPFTGQATLTPNGEYRLDAELPEEVAHAWRDLKVTDQMPFRLIVSPAAGSP